MIKSFADKNTQSLFETGRSRVFPSDILARALRKLDMLDAAFSIDDLKVPPSNRLHKLLGDLDSYLSISVNDKWRICFKFDDRNAYDVLLCDYH